MNTTSNMINPSEERTGGTGGAEPDEPGSAGDSDLPPEPIVPDSPAESSGGVCVDVIDETDPGTVDVDEAWIGEQLLRALVHIPKEVSRVTISILDDVPMAQLHRRHCNVEGPTDVLTFAVSEPGEPIEADIAICADVAMRRVETCDHDINHELLLYALHGVLHCVGFDDHEEADYRAMHAEEDRILRAIGVGAVFDIGSEASS